MTGLVGREAQLAVLDDALRDCVAGVGRLVLISGEAGIGKTRLADTAIEHARAAGLQVLRGYAVDDAGAPPLWPWLRAAQGLPSLSAALAEPLVGIVDSSERFRRFVAVADELSRLGQPDGLLVVLEDLHWADRSTTFLLRHLASEIGSLPLLLLVTYRETSGSHITDVLPDLLRGDNSRLLRLSGLDDGAVACWLRQLPELTGWSALAGELRARTDGNPLLVRLVTEDLPGAGEPGPDTLDAVLANRPDVRRLITARLSRLSAAASEVVVAASVVGERISAGLLAAVTGLSDDDIAAALREATVQTVFSVGPNGLSFTHALVRDAVYADLLPAARANLHRRVALALEGVGRTGIAGLIAGHWQRAGGPDDAPEWLRWARRATDEARSMQAHEEAAGFAALAVSAGEQAGLGIAERAALVLELAQARLTAGQIGASLEACVDAARLADQADRPDLMGAAALVLHGVGSVDVSRVIGGLCTRALERCPADGQVTRARLLAQLAVCAAEEGRPDAPDLAATALAEAELAGDGVAILEAIAARHFAITVPGSVDERIQLADRAIELGSRSAQPMSALWGHLWRIDDAFQLGDLAEVDRQLAEIDQIANDLRSTVARWHYWRLLATRSALIGDFADARASTEQAFALARRMGDISMVGMRHAFLGQLALVRGDPADLPPTEFLRAAPQIPLVKVFVAIHLAIKGKPDEARAAFEEFRHLPAVYPFGVRWAAMMSQIGFAAVLLDDSEVAAAVYEQLLPTAQYCTGDGSGAVFCFGSNARMLADLGLTAGMFDEALRHYADAVAVNARIGARPFTALSRLGWASALFARQSTDQGSKPLASRDLDLAVKLARQAAAEFRRLDMPGPLNTADLLLTRLAAAQRSSSPLSDRERQVAGLIAAALSNREIAGQLFLSERTVESHVRSILSKLGFGSRTEIATWAVRQD